jgi:enoyl-CoA hydratase
MSAPILVETRGRALLVTIQRPEVKNAIDFAAAQAINAAMDRLDDEPDLFVGVIYGAGGVFSAGADLKAAGRGDPPARAVRGAFGLCERLPKKPLIAAVEGLALGGGFEICLACDMIVAAHDAQFGLPEVKRNLVAFGGGAVRLPHRLTPQLAAEIALTGEPVSTERLHTLGVVNRLTDKGGALAGALELAELVARNGPTAIAATAQIMRLSVNAGEHEAWARQRDIGAPAINSEDRAEALRAFREKRAPEWKGF